MFKAHRLWQTKKKKIHSKQKFTYVSPRRKYKICLRLLTACNFVITLSLQANFVFVFVWIISETGCTKNELIQRIWSVGSYRRSIYLDEILIMFSIIHKMIRNFDFNYYFNLKTLILLIMNSYEIQHNLTSRVNKIN